MRSITLDRPWLEFDLQAKMQVLNWAVNRPGFVGDRRIVWREVSNAALPKNLNVEKWLASEFAVRGVSDAVAFLTSRDVRSFCQETVAIEGIEAQAVATVGLLNVERVGRRNDWTGQDWGTINVAVRINQGLSPGGLLEAMSIAVQARTAAEMDIGIELLSKMNCIAMSAAYSPSLHLIAALHSDRGGTTANAKSPERGHGQSRAINDTGRLWFGPLS